MVKRNNGQTIKNFTNKCAPTLRMALDQQIRKEKTAYFLDRENNFTFSFQSFERQLKHTTSDFYDRRQLMNFYLKNKHKHLDADMLVDEFLNNQFNFSDRTMDHNDDEYS